MAIDPSKDVFDAGIAAFSEALKYCSLDTSPANYAYVHTQLSVLYIQMSDFIYSEEFAQKAVESLNEAAKVYTIDQYPLYYSQIQYYLGASYRTIAEISGEEEYYFKALKSFEPCLCSDKACQIEYPTVGKYKQGY